MQSREVWTTSRVGGGGRSRTDNPCLIKHTISEQTQNYQRAQCEVMTEQSVTQSDSQSAAEPLSAPSC